MKEEEGFGKRERDDGGWRDEDDFGETSAAERRLLIASMMGYICVWQNGGL